MHLRLLNSQKVFCFMESKLTLKEAKKERDYFPCLFSNKDNSIVILATERTGEKTFAGVVIYSCNETKKGTFGVYSTGWTYQQFSRLPKGSEITLEMIQED